MSDESRTEAAIRIRTVSNYDIEPTTRISDDALTCRVGWAAISETLRNVIHPGRQVVVAECYPGTDSNEIVEGLAGLKFDSVICAEQALQSSSELLQMLAPYLGDDPVFGLMHSWQLREFFDSTKLAGVRRKLAESAGTVLVYGTGAAFVAEQWDLLLYFDVVRWEIQRRQRAGLKGNLGADNHGSPPAQLYKRCYFVDWRACDTEKHRLSPNFDYYIDTNRAQSPALLPGKEYRAALSKVTMRPFRLVPFFDPGPWGGEWMRRNFDLPVGPPNFAWCFDCVPEENSLRLGFGEHVVEVPALSLVHEHPSELLGEHVFQQFGSEFPIRFDLLDTVEGGNLSLQVHPTRSYVAEHFGLSYTQDESYYMLDAESDAVVYLGLRDGIDPDGMARDLETAQVDGSAFPVDQYINKVPVKKHDHVSIPAGTVHCSGKNSMVLEISATPYIFTFKLWDWGRLGMDGKARPIHLQHGLANIQWERNHRWVEKNLVNPVEEVAKGTGWREERTGLHEFQFLETRRHWFTGLVEHDTDGTVNVLNLVEGDEVIVQSPQGSFEPQIIHYAETFVVPASVGRYTISPVGSSGKVCATLKAFVRKDFAF